MHHYRPCQKLNDKILAKSPVNLQKALELICLFLENIGMIDLIDLLSCRKYEKAARSLFLRAFPPEERPSFAYMERAAISGQVELNIAVEEGEFVGLAFVVRAPNFSYLFFLAIIEEKRNHGYGHKILSLVKDKYGDKPILLLAESLNVPCDNLEQRQKRMAFYHSAGYSSLDYGSEEYGVAYDALSSGGYVDFFDYYRAMEGFWGKEETAKWVKRI